MLASRKGTAAGRVIMRAMLETPAAANSRAACSSDSELHPNPCPGLFSEANNNNAEILVCGGLVSLLPLPRMWSYCCASGSDWLSISVLDGLLDGLRDHDLAVSDHLWRMADSLGSRA